MIDWILIDKSLHGQLTPEERKVLERWLAESASHRALYARIGADKRITLDQERYDGALATFEAAMRKPRRRRIRWSAAAAIFIPLMVGIYMLLPRTQQAGETLMPQPGRTAATLTLPSGEVVELGGEGAQIVETPGRVAVMEGEKLVYQADESGYGVNSTVTVQRGGEYNLTLADGTQVWLNSGSHLSYPAAFGPGRRQVALVGEAYFIVAADQEKPFVVTTGGYDIVVTGTQFNVRSFEGQPTVTTLVEGSVEIEFDGHTTRLRPGQQSVLADGALTVADVNVAEYTAWREGYFNFPQQPLGDILDELARWYDVEVVYVTPQARDMNFVARFSRQAPLEQVLDILMKTRRVKLVLDGRQITVS